MFVFFFDHFAAQLWLQRINSVKHLLFSPFNSTPRQGVAQNRHIRERPSSIVPSIDRLSILLSYDPSWTLVRLLMLIKFVRLLCL